MQIMTSADRALLDKLTRLARGNDGLVLEAMRQTARADGPTPLSEITAYIKERRAGPENMAPSSPDATEAALAPSAP